MNGDLNYKINTVSSAILWSMAEMDTLRIMWMAGALVADIVPKLGRTAGAIERKRGKLGLPPRLRAAVNRKTTLKPYRASPHPRKVILPSTAMSQPCCPSVGLFERTGCAWPVGNIKPQLFCNSGLSGPSDYCDYHLHIKIRPRN